MTVGPLTNLLLVLSWDAIIETLLEDDYLQKHGSNDDGAAAAHLVIINALTQADSILICDLQSMYGLSSKDDDTLKAFIDPDMATLRVRADMLLTRRALIVF